MQIVSKGEVMMVVSDWRTMYWVDIVEGRIGIKLS